MFMIARDVEHWRLFCWAARLLLCGKLWQLHTPTVNTLPKLHWSEEKLHRTISQPFHRGLSALAATTVLQQDRTKYFAHRASGKWLALRFCK
jgi:hypothetical protein